MPRDLPEALLTGLEWDAVGQRYNDLAELNAYAARVAGTVGAMMYVLMGVRSPDLAARACDLGVAMQLTNIARDVGEDARAGRIYLPLSWMREAGIDPDAWLARPRFTKALGAVIARLLDAADILYARADAGIAGLPASCRPGIRAARLLYAEIGQELRRNRFDSVSRRTIVPADRKLRLIWRAMARPGSRHLGIADPCLEQVQFLVDAIAGIRPMRTATPALKWWDLHGQAIRAIDLFERLERRERSQYASREPNQATA
jgi:phytoene synthase